MNELDHASVLPSVIMVLMRSEVLTWRLFANLACALER